ncbi:Diaminopimelate decarboxylase [Limihaloglobus sulfuriphilus]|uniref:Diaminopimelate decarboxylase n=1 Tax=Limihaloglobus sulfuriphilus TaxID=1851148 RepID=A0A1Q2MDQ8_9BACT|nr:diaminopimelate decarboxylase [Limihaloglobus sulfuriphilus]AQQ70447.1 Diaminopimelate decarboxylase [Limihaloglobus sulfuriphilus]
MDGFKYKDGRLYAEDISIQSIIDKVGTPAYIYCKNTFLDHLKKIQQAYSEIDTTICYSVKACGNINILRHLAQMGSGFDIVSGGELFRVQQAGGDMSKVVYAGVGKTDAEIKNALDARIGYFNIESEAELENLIKIAKEKNTTAKAALRVNPDVDPKTHTFITTGKKESKFGVDIERAQKVFADYADNGSVKLCALHVHLGSGGNTIDPYVEALEKTANLVEKLRENGHTIEAVDLGGGYGADYETGYSPSAKEYAVGIVPIIKKLDVKLILEPGKSIAANAGILATQVQYIKKGGTKEFAIVDAGMNDLLRPPLYDAFHFIWPAKVEKNFVPEKRTKDLDISGCTKYDVVGPICEGSDFFAKNRLLPPLKRGDLLCIFTAGAYGHTMGSNYNARPMLPEILVDGDKFQVIRRRQTYEDLVAPEQI